MIVIINGKPREIPDGTTVGQLLQDLGLGEERVAVEHNLNILDSTSFSEVALSDGDALEIVRFVGGG